MYSQVVALNPTSTRGLKQSGKTPKQKNILNIDVLNKPIPSLYYHATYVLHETIETDQYQLHCELLHCKMINNRFGIRQQALNLNNDS